MNESDQTAHGEDEVEPATSEDDSGATVLPAQEVIMIDGSARTSSERATVQAVIQVYPAGSLPSPEAMHEYERMAPGVGARWVENFLSETDHRRKRELAQDRSLTRAQWFSLAIMLAALIVVLVAVLERQPIPAGLGFIGVAALGYVFLTQSRKEDGGE